MKVSYFQPKTTFPAGFGNDCRYLDEQHVCASPASVVSPSQASFQEDGGNAELAFSDEEGIMASPSESQGREARHQLLCLERFSDKVSRTSSTRNSLSRAVRTLEARSAASSSFAFAQSDLLRETLLSLEQFTCSSTGALTVSPDCPSALTCSLEGERPSSRSRPGMTFAVDWALKNNYVSIYPSSRAALPPW